METKEIKAIVPKKSGGIVGAARDAFFEMFGQLLTGKFWLEVGKVAIHAFFVAVGESFIKMLGGSISYYKQPGGMSENSSRAFGGAFTPSPGYNPAPSFPVSSSPNGDGRFPGFANR